MSHNHFAQIVVLSTLLGCASLDSHENFKAHMQAHVGKSISDQYGYPNRYPNRVAGRHNLPNGNFEVEYLSGGSKDCRVFFQVDKESQKIISWRYEGTREACRIAV
jgi:hypothetical protein